MVELFNFKYVSTPPLIFIQYYLVNLIQKVTLCNLLKILLFNQLSINAKLIIQKKGLGL